MIAECITINGDVISKEQEGFFVAILNNIPFEEIRTYFLNKQLLLSIKENHKKTNGSCGITKVKLRDIFSLQEIESSIAFLEQKKIIVKKEGINNDLYLLNNKKQ